MWKPLSIVSGLILLGTGGLMYLVVQPEFKAEKAQLAASKANFKSASDNQTESNKKNADSKDDVKNSGALLNKNTIEKEAAKTAKAKAVKETEDAQARKDTDEKALVELQKKLEGLGGLDEVVAQLKLLEAKKAQLEADKKNTIDVTAALVAHKKSTDDVITALKIREIYQKTGTVREGASTRIVEVSQELGFYVFGAGNSANITKNSKWDVVRDNTVIARLVVTHIEQNRAVAELVPGTLAQGNQVMPGDRVVVSSSSTPRALAASITSAAKTTGKLGDKKPANDGTTPAATDAPVTDPFAAPGGNQPMEKPAETPAPAPAEAPAPTDAPKEANP